MADMLLRQIGLVSESKRVKPSQLTKVSAALQKQATRDLVQFWNVKATVDAFARLEDLRSAIGPSSSWTTSTNPARPVSTLTETVSPSRW
jgi:hypothetical protein